ncbi:MAG TPA: ferritin-like domain-containing protein, partial [Chitinophagaceae bacterium]|nr:ferritin-like domain-containing protein [Chitinophagaceae bacterium]
MEKMNDLRDLLRHEIQDLYSAEEQIIAAMPKMINKATDRTLTASLSEHLAITQKQKQRLDRVQQLLGEEAQANGSKKKGLLSGLFSKKHTCKAMQGIIEEGNTILAADMSTEVRDAAIIACAQKIEHYEICGYGTARTYARELGMEKVAQLLEETLNEEYEADDKLTSLAVSRINREAESGSRGRARSASEGQMRGERTRE